MAFTPLDIKNIESKKTKESRPALGLLAMS
jgi:hypothetical protein